MPGITPLLEITYGKPKIPAPTIVPTSVESAKRKLLFMCSHEESNLDFSLRRAALYPLSYGNSFLIELFDLLLLFFNVSNGAPDSPFFSSNMLSKTH